MIARQDDVGDRVLALLRGGTENFSINTASSAEYDAAFDTAANSLSEYIRASENDYSYEYYDPSMTIETSEPKDEYDADGTGEVITQSIKISGTSDYVFSNDIYVTLYDIEGAAKFFIVKPTNTKSFDVDICADKESKGLYAVDYFTVQNGELKISPYKIIAYAPKFASSVTPYVYWTSAGNIYARAGDEIYAGLIAEGGGMKYDISAPELGVVSYEFSDSSVAEITSLGVIKALKEGRTTITAHAYGQTASVNFIVKQSASESDTTKDISVSYSENSGPGSSKGGCSVLPGTLILLSVTALLAKKR